MNATTPEILADFRSCLIDEGHCPECLAGRLGDGTQGDWCVCRKCGYDAGEEALADE